MTILRLILQARDLEEGNEVSLADFYEKIPFMELEDMDGLTGADKIRKMQPLRFMKTHLSYELWKNTLDKHPNLKVIQTLRNPRDTLVSFYHHMRSDGCLGCFTGTWDQYFEEFKKRRLPWGDFFEVNSSWYKFNKYRPNSLILCYEEMKKDHKGQLSRLPSSLDMICLIKPLTWSLRIPPSKKCQKSSLLLKKMMLHGTQIGPISFERRNWRLGQFLLWGTNYIYGW